MWDRTASMRATFSFAGRGGAPARPPIRCNHPPALAGGGPLYDVGSHRIDACNFLFGRPRRATGLLSNALHSLQVEDSATVLIEYAGGVHAVVDVRWNSRIQRDQFRVIGLDGGVGLDR